MSISSGDGLIVYSMVHVDIDVTIPSQAFEFNEFRLVAFVVSADNLVGIGNFVVQSEQD